MASQYIDFSQPSLYISAASILFNPTFWNLAARREYHHRTLTRLAPNQNPLHACYCLAFTIFTLGLLRDYLYHRALLSQPTHPLLTTPLANALAVALIACGNVLVLSSMWALGVTGTYLGDYFGILMEGMVTGFPFSVSSAPMYHGSTMSFFDRVDRSDSRLSSTRRRSGR